MAKSKVTSGPMRPGRNGGKLKTGGSHPNSGRPPDEFKTHMRSLLSQADVEDYFQRCLRGEFGPKFHLAARREVEHRAYGRPEQPVSLGNAGGDAFEIIVREE